MGVPTERSTLLGHEAANDITPSSERAFFDEENPSAPAKPIAPSATAHLSMSSSSSSSSSLSASMVSIFYKLSIVVLVCSVGVMGWYLSSRSSHSQDGLSSLKTYTSHLDPSEDGPPRLNLWGQFFGYLCAVFYLGSRVPQFLLNYSRKSTEGVSILFFIFCCIGNVTYALSIFAYEPHCTGDERVHHRGRLPGKCENGDWERAYWRYILVDASWVIGSIGALVLDLAIFSQFWLYRGRKR